MTPLSEVVESALGGHRAPGAVVAVQAQGSQLDLAAVNAERSELFEIGSVAKTMTALLILQHVQRGDIQLDDSIKSYLPDLQPGDQDQTAQVTIRHLLTHTSGIDCGDDFTDTGDDDDCLGTFVSEALTGVGFLFPPGQRWSYNNGGYSILGRLIEVLDDRTWDDALIDRVFVPLGMSATTTARLNPELLISRRFRVLSG
jgi:CubicO group peptidase (beta-lactamase class C family)